MRAYYFGCVGEPGHHMYRPGYVKDWNWLDKNPWGHSIDSGLCPGGYPQVEGQSRIHHKDGWTAMAFWDRSVDHRGMCNSAFMAEGTFTFAEMMAIATEAFPSVLARFNFPIVEATPTPSPAGPGQRREG